MATMSKTAKQIAYFLNTRPLWFLSTVFGIRDIIVGLALLFPSDYDGTVLHANLDALGGCGIYGILLAVIALTVVVTAAQDKTRWTQWGLKVMSWFWLFASISYALSGHWTFAVANLFMCSIPAGYISFYYKWTHAGARLKRDWRVNHGLEPAK